MGTVTYIFCTASLWRKIQYHTAALRAPAALLSDPMIKASRPEWLTLKWRGNTNLHGGTSQIRGENGAAAADANASEKKLVPKDDIGPLILAKIIDIIDYSNCAIGFGSN